MAWPCAFARARRRAGRLAERTSLGVGGRPEFLFEPTTVDEAGEALLRCSQKGVPVRVLGGGTNLLVTDDALEGAVIATGGLDHLRAGRDRVAVGAGCSLPGLVRRAPALGLPGLAGCVGIPGTVGGAVTMNAGGRFGCVGDALLEVAGLDRRGRPYRRRVRDGDLGYRQSAFADTVVTEAVFRRDAGLDAEAERRRSREALALKRRSQPLAARSAGCVFKNPAGRPAAARLIDEAGLKGRRVGEAVVSTLHANFILNEGTANATDVHALIRAVREEVRSRHGVDLELEVHVWS